jgi:recombination protein RecA
VGRVNTASIEQLSTLQQEVVIGTLLGDGRLECRSQSGGARLRVHHADSQHDFLMWKYDIFRNIVTKEPWKVSWQGTTTGNLYVAWFFHTKTLFSLRSLQQLFYPVGKKVVPINIGDLLTPLSLAVWYMDDGCLSGNSIILNTQCFSIAEQAILQEYLQDRWDIEARLHKDRLTYRLGMNRENAERFLDVLRPYIPPCMQYKITPRND